MAADPDVQQQAAANTEENFGLEFDKRFIDALVTRMGKAEELTIRMLNDVALRGEITAAMLPRVYERARVAYQMTCPIGELLASKEDRHLEFKSTLRWDAIEDERERERYIAQRWGRD